MSWTETGLNFTALEILSSLSNSCSVSSWDIVLIFMHILKVYVYEYVRTMVLNY